MGQLAWEAIGSDKLRATFDDRSTKASVDFQIDADARLLGASADNRPRMVGKTIVETPWTFGEYKTFETLRVARARGRVAGAAVKPC